ncbi:MAG TPA: hypothetical protein VK390_01370 [Propionibacteriaceae bacterium]|nr:hypothetical protein [Propionibacteriaceae bacterium]
MDSPHLDAHARTLTATRRLVLKVAAASAAATLVGCLRPTPTGEPPRCDSTMCTGPARASCQLAHSGKYRTEPDAGAVAISATRGGHRILRIDDLAQGCDRMAAAVR